MCSLFRNKFRNESIRMNSHDYSASGTYFITICTHLGQSYFGNILNGKMILSGTGLIAYKIWHEIPEHFSFISLDAFVVMPNHVHGIVIIQSATSLQSRISVNVIQYRERSQICNQVPGIRFHLPVSDKIRLH